MNKLSKIYIVEDMAVTRASLISMLVKNKFDVVGSSASAEKALLDLANVKPDLLLLDINLSGEKTGVWLASKIRALYDIAIIYLTAYGDVQTLESVMQTNPDGYIMKPYLEPTLITNINIVLDKTKKKEPENFTFIKVDQSHVKLHFADILYAKSEGNYIEIFTNNAKYVIRQKMSEFHATLDPKILIRVHQRYVINKNQVLQYTTDKVIINDVEIPVSNKYKSNLIIN